VSDCEYTAVMLMGFGVLFAIDPLLGAAIFCVALLTDAVDMYR
jgi:hypothetical protein